MGLESRVASFESQVLATIEMGPRSRVWSPTKILGLGSLYFDMPVLLFTPLSVCNIVFLGLLLSTDFLHKVRVQYKSHGTYLYGNSLSCQKGAFWVLKSRFLKFIL